MVRKAILTALVTLVVTPNAVADAGSADKRTLATFDQACAKSANCSVRGSIAVDRDTVTVCTTYNRDARVADAKFCGFEGRLQPDGQTYQASGSDLDDGESPCQIEVSQVGNVLKVTPAGPNPAEMASRCREEHCGVGGSLFGAFQVVSSTPDDPRFQCAE